uniref:Uncharacterized protein n=1 Tax=Romanomermis culicivorax TaxID=13658 RepID=A0A915IFC9_ROMCU
MGPMVQRDFWLLALLTKGTNHGRHQNARAVLAQKLKQPLLEIHAPDSKSTLEVKERKILKPAGWTEEDINSMEAKSQWKEVEEVKVQSIIDEANIKMLGIDVGLDKTQDLVEATW